MIKEVAYRTYYRWLKNTETLEHWCCCKTAHFQSFSIALLLIIENEEKGNKEIYKAL